MSNSSNARQKNKYEFVADGVYIFKRFDKKYVDSRGLYQLYAYYDGQNYRRSLKTVDRAIALERAGMRNRAAASRRSVSFEAGMLQVPEYMNVRAA